MGLDSHLINTHTQDLKFQITGEAVGAFTNVSLTLNAGSFLSTNKLRSLRGSLWQDGHGQGHRGGGRMTDRDTSYSPIGLLQPQSHFEAFLASSPGALSSTPPSWPKASRHWAPQEAGDKKRWQVEAKE